MADNKTIDNGALTDFTAATDEIGGVDYQYVKLVDGTLDSTTKVGADANGLWVNIKTITAGAKIQLTDGTSDATVRNLAANDALNVAIVDGSGNHITSIGGTGGTSATDDADFTAGSTTGTPVMGAYNSSVTAVTDTDMGIIGIDAQRRVKVTVDANTLDVAHDVADAGAPVKVGGRALSAMPTAVATGDRTNANFDLYGRQLTAQIDPGMQVWKAFNATTAQTGVVVWDPAAGKKIAITYIGIGTYGTTGARLILFFDSTTTYTPGTDQVAFAASFVPSTTAKPGAIITPPSPIYSATADLELRVTTDAALSFDLTVYGFEL